jgi:hypothetical protein
VTRPALYVAEAADRTQARAEMITSGKLSDRLLDDGNFLAEVSV